MFLTEKLIAAQREASRRVAEGEVYSVSLPILGRVPVPSPRQLAIYAVLGGLAALELIDWPVALAMGVGSALVSRQLSDLEAREEELAEAIGSEAPARTEAATAKRAAAKKAPAKKAPAKNAPAKNAPAKGAAAQPAVAKQEPATEFGAQT